MNTSKIAKVFWTGVCWLLGLTMLAMVVGVFLRMLDFSFWIQSL